ncbi:unnamed protein product [Rhizoctonia solani]|uniref:Phosphoglycerate mutase family protein n=1 Tax=Rhizoctonia solani TaxID=456999 RepID=A0A8H3D594_9AGAM|nr:unnamed protein product [Rhizoctonia solani]
MYKDLLVYIIRHGETNENRLGIIQGHMDTQLNDAGRTQAETTGRSLRDVNFVKAYSSDSTRAADTARAIVAYHPDCELILDDRIRERNMGSLSGTKAPAKRPLPPDIETSESMANRLLDFWGNVIVSLLSSSATSRESGDPDTKPEAAPSADSVVHHPSSLESRTPAVLIVSHGATISKLLTYVLLRKYGYRATCEMRRGIYNTSISIVRMGTTAVIRELFPSNDGDDTEECEQPIKSVSGVLISCASVSHLIKKRDLVAENADMLRTLIAPKRIGPKLVKESHIGASGMSASAAKKAGQSVVEVQRGENYQFAYFLKPAESYDLLTKARDFVAVTAPPASHEERDPTPEPPTTRQTKRAPKRKSRPKTSAAARKRKRVESEEEDAEMSDAWSDLDEEIPPSDEDETEVAPSGTAPTRRSTRHKSGPQVHDIDEEMHDQNVDGPSGATDQPTPVIVKSEPDDTAGLESLLTISADDEVASTPSQSPRPPSDTLIVEQEEEKPKQELQITYTGYMVPSRCLCVIAEPWPALPTPAQLASQASKSRSKPSEPPSPGTSRPLFRPESDDEDKQSDTHVPRRALTPEFDSDDEEAKLRMFSQMINKVGVQRSGVATRGAMDEFEDDALYGDADEEGRGT